MYIITKKAKVARDATFENIGGKEVPLSDMVKQLKVSCSHSKSGHKYVSMCLPAVATDCSLSKRFIRINAALVPYLYAALGALPASILDPHTEGDCADAQVQIDVSEAEMESETE